MCTLLLFLLLLILLLLSCMCHFTRFTIYFLFYPSCVSLVLVLLFIQFLLFVIRRGKLCSMLFWSWLEQFPQSMTTCISKLFPVVFVYFENPVSFILLLPFSSFEFSVIWVFVLPMILVLWENLSQGRMCIGFRKCFQLWGHTQNLYVSYIYF